MSLKHLLKESIEDLKRSYVDKWKDNTNFKRWFKDSKVIDDSGDPLIVFHATDKDFDSFGVGDIGYHFGVAKSARERIGVGHLPFDPHKKEKVIELIDISNMSLPEYDEFLSDDGITNFINDIEDDFSGTGEELENLQESLFKIQEHFMDDFESIEEFYEKNPTEKDREKYLKEKIAMYMNDEHMNFLGGNKTMPEGRTGAYFLKIENPLFTEDIQVWNDPHILQDEIPIQLFYYSDVLKSSEELEKMKEEWHGSMRIQDIKKYLMDLGYDGIKYENYYEAKGSISWIAFEPTQIKSIFNSGEFDPNNQNYMK